jgi:hypothetical protein
LKLNDLHKEFRRFRTELWNGPFKPHQEEEPRVPRKANWGYGFKLKFDKDYGWDGILY